MCSRPLSSLPSLLSASDDERSILTFSPELVFFVILPPIILDAGYTLKRKDFFRNLGTITMLAVVGTIINNLAFGYLMFGFAKLGWIPLNSSSPLECLLFGAVISATDPVATLAMLGSKEVNADPLLYSLVFGESVLNDAVAIVLYKTFDNALPSTSDPDAKTTFSVWDLFKALLTFIGVSLGSLCVGIGIALACSFIFKRVDFSRMPIYEFTLVTLFAFLSYFMAETMYLSGIMAIFFCSVCLAHYNYYNISTNAQIATQEGFKSIAQICETFVFAYLGITAGLSISTSHLLWSFGMIILTIIACPIARAVNVFPICAIANTRRQGAQKITPAMQSQPRRTAAKRGNERRVSKWMSSLTHVSLFVFVSLSLSSPLVCRSSRRGCVRPGSGLPGRQHEVRRLLDAHAHPLLDHRQRRPHAAGAEMDRHVARTA